MQLRRKPEFTLSELLLAIDIIALMSGLVLPTLGNARESGRQAVCRPNMRQLMVGMHSYANVYKVITGEKFERHEVGIVLIGYTGMAEARWDITEALPIKWSGPAFKSGSGEAAVETLELIHHGFKRAK